MRQRLSHAPGGDRSRGWHRLARHLIPNTGTLIVLALFLLVQVVAAESPPAPLAQGPAATLISYQGTLTDKNGVPIDQPMNMGFALYRQAEGGTHVWSKAYTGIQVIDGHFHVLLDPLDPAVLTGNLYLGTTVNGEELLPREPLVSSVVSRLVVSSGGTSMIEGHLQVGDNTWIPAFADMDGSDMAVYGQFEQRGSGGARVSKLGIGTNPGLTTGSLALSHGIQVPFRILSERPWEFTQSGHRTALRSTVAGGGKRFEFWNQDGTPILGVAANEANGGALDMSGHPINNCGALVEANLQTPEELAAARIDRFEEGDVLCWKDEQLEKCEVAADRLVQAVADRDGRPIVIGAEVVKVLGPVQAGDMLVASDVPGYAMVNNNPRPGSVIAQALEDFDGERGVVKAMIRKF